MTAAAVAWHTISGTWELFSISTRVATTSSGRRFISRGWPSIAQIGENFSKGGGEQHKLVIMASAGKVAKRVPLIKFPNRKAGVDLGSKSVDQTVGGGSSQAMPSFSSGPPPIPAGTASSQPPRTKLTVAEIEAILLGGAAS